MVAFDLDDMVNDTIERKLFPSHSFYTTTTPFLLYTQFIQFIAFHIHKNEQIE